MQKKIIGKNKLKTANGLRLNNGKLRYDLLEPYAIQELVKVFTKGAEKYSDFNWLDGGMDYSKMLASLKRHIAAFELGEDIDQETQCLHMAQAAWNALALVSYSKYCPENDDRIIHKLLSKKKNK
jgi:hypothetical protein